MDAFAKTVKIKTKGHIKLLRRGHKYLDLFFWLVSRQKLLFQEIADPDIPGRLQYWII